MHEYQARFIGPGDYEPGKKVQLRLRTVTLSAPAIEYDPGKSDTQGSTTGKLNERRHENPRVTVDRDYSTVEPRFNLIRQDGRALHLITRNGYLVVEQRHDEKNTAQASLEEAYGIDILLTNNISTREIHSMRKKLIRSGLTTIADLEMVALGGLLSNVGGLGPKRVAFLKESLRLYRQSNPFQP